MLAYLSNVWSIPISSPQKNPDAGEGIRIYDECRFSTYEDSQCAGGAIGKDLATQVEAGLRRSFRAEGGAVDGEISGVCQS